MSEIRFCNVMNEYFENEYSSVKLMSYLNAQSILKVLKMLNILVRTW